MRARYTAWCRRYGDWWAISVAEVPAISSWAVAFEQVGPVARKAIAAALGVGTDTFDLDVRRHPPAPWLWGP
jgi:hypothetical protein